MYDVIIIGAGPSGLTAAMYAARRMMKTLVISQNIGGQVIWASEIHNFPGVKNANAIELAQSMSQQVKDLGVEIKIEPAVKIGRDGEAFSVQTSKNSYQAKTLVIAMGMSPKQLNLPNENELTGKGISYCANCDAPLYKNKNVAVVGGGNSALDAAEVLSKIAKQVYLIYHKEKPKAFESLVEEVKKRTNVSLKLNYDVKEIIGSGKLEKLKLVNLSDQSTSEIEVDGLFIEIGHAPKTDILAGLVERDEKGQVIADMNGLTSAQGIFAAGDVTAHEFKQIIIGCGQGAVAALSAYKYLQLKK